VEALLAAAFGGLMLGLATAFSPCPLATNLAATAWLARHAGTRRRALFGAAAYTLGRVAAYGAIAAVLAAGLVRAPEISSALQRWLPPFLGPLLILTAMVLLDLISVPWFRGGTSQATAEKLARLGLAGEFALGFLFALSFCPVSAALFFGSLLPPALATNSVAVPVILFGVGTAVPVAVFSIGVALSAEFAGRFSRAVGRWQARIRIATGVALLAIGLFLIARDSLGWISG
jgi:cytochrome c biogenesis protein CcdA